MIGRDDEQAAWCRMFRLLFNDRPAHVALLDQQGIILETNKAWREFGSQNGLRSGYDCVGQNYLQACEQGAAENFPGASEAYIGVLEVLHARRPKFTMVYPCHSPKERRWYRMWVEPQSPDIPAVVVAHYPSIRKSPDKDASSTASFGVVAAIREELHAGAFFEAGFQAGAKNNALISAHCR